MGQAQSMAPNRNVINVHFFPPFRPQIRLPSPQNSQPPGHCLVSVRGRELCLEGQSAFSFIHCFPCHFDGPYIKGMEFQEVYMT